MIIKTGVLMGVAGGALLQATLAVAQPDLPDQNPTLWSEHTIDMSLAEAVALGLRRNYSIRSLKLQRLRERFDLRVAQDQFNPQLKLSATHTFSRGTEDRTRASEVAPTVSVLGEYGTRLELGWKQQLNASRNTGERQSDGLDLAVIQPLLRGAGKDVTTAPLRQARLAEQINRLNAKASVSQTLSEIITGYHGPRFDTFYMCIRAAQVGCGVALLPRFLVEEELADGKLVIAWQHLMTSRDAYYLAYPEHSAGVPKVRDFVSWIMGQVESD